MKPRIIIAQVDGSGTAESRTAETGPTLKFAVSKASCSGELSNLAERIDSPGFVVNWTYWENDWSPLVTGNFKLSTVKS
jgi:hypothetical protein